MGHAQFSTTKTEWPFSVKPLTPHLGAEISGVNLSEEMTPDILAGIHRAFCNTKFFCFRHRKFPQLNKSS